MGKLNTSNVYADTRKMSREEWLESRRNGIGGSDASAILGVNPYSKPLNVYADKIGVAQEQEENEAMRQGRDLEPYVAERFCEYTGLKVKKCNRILQHPEYPWMLANIDRQVIGQNAGLECKTTSAFSKFKFDQGEINPHYYWQSMHYMAVTGAEKWYVAVLVQGKDFQVFGLDRDEDAIQTLIEAERQFWEEHVVPKVPPLPTGSEADGEALNALYPAAEVEDAAIDLGGLDDLLNLRGMKVEQRDALQKEIDDIDQQIKAEMGTFERGVSGNWTVRWSNTESRRVDTKALKAKYPKIAEECVKVTKGRRFTVSRVEEE